MTALTERILKTIQAVPEGSVASYGTIARAAGNPRALRQVVRVLHSMSASRDLPWQRIINKKGYIAIKDPEGAFLQKKLLEAEGVFVSEGGRVDMNRFEVTAEDLKKVQAGR